MATFAATDGTIVGFLDRGQGPAVLLLHGFAANAGVNWERSGVIGALADAGYRVLAADLRGHGRSGTPHQPEAYGAARFVDDATGLLDHLGLGAAAIVGYSLGSRVAMLAAAADPRFRAVVLGGAGARSMTDPDEQTAESLAAAMEAPRASEVSGRGRAFRSFAEATGSDLVALAALQRALPSWPAPVPAGIRVPVLVVAGTNDDLAGPPGPLAERFPNGQAATVPGNHMNAVTNRAFAEAVVGFLDRLPRW
ncbi:MAG: alpha/beta fold hydrolase [Acidimicrobiales bacterium]|nr:alpha/beta fold hydrolase [Acidimicrobiales bacterium]MBO0894101.1 alpha/beta fold hydrolase [Acidimicrobiales bacterium]